MNNNVFTQEINKFAQLADRWWDPQGPLKSLHDINPLRMDFIRQHTFLRDAKILDVGCGGGILTESLAKFSPKEIMGIDLADASLEVAKKHAQTMDLFINYQNQSIEELSLKQPAHFDVITCMELLEHVPDPQAIVHHCASLLTTGGKLFVSTINQNIKAYLQAIIAAEYLLKIVPKHTHDYRYFITPAQLARMARQAGLQLTAMQGFSYKPLTQKYFSTPTVGVNYMAAYQKLS